MEAERRQNMSMKRRLARVKLAAQKQKEAARAKKEAERQRKAELALAEEKAKAEKALLEREFDDGELGQGKRNGGDLKHRQARRDFLDRCRLKFGPLPPELEEIWPQFREWFAERVATEHKSKVGAWLLEQLRSFKKASSAQKAFVNWVRTQWSLKPKPANRESV